MNKYVRDLKIASLVVMMLAICTILFQLLDGDASVTIVSMNLAIASVSLAYVLTPNTENAETNDGEVLKQKRPVAQIVLFGMTALFFGYGFLSALKIV